MNKLTFALVGAAALALAACGSKNNDSLSNDVQVNNDNAVENLDTMSSNTENAGAADTLQNQATELKPGADKNANAADEDDDNAQDGANSAAAVNAM